MFLFVKTLVGKTIAIDCEDDACSMTVPYLKARVSEEWGCPVSEVRILWAGKEMVRGTIGENGFTNADHSITAVHRPAVMAGGGQVAAEPAGGQVEDQQVDDLLVDVSSDHRPPHHPPPIELPRDIHTLSEEEQLTLLMALTKSRDELRG